MKTLKIGLLSAVQASFWGSGEKLFEAHYAPKMLEISKELGFELYVARRAVSSGAEAEAAAKELEGQGLDFLLVQLSTFSSGDIIEPLARAGIRLGLWGLPEITGSGPIPLNSFCGMNMYSSIIGQYVGKDIKYKWFYGDVGDGLFIDRLRITVKALTALKNQQGTTVALIGGIAPGFDNLYYDERKTKDALGVKVDRLREFADIKSRALAYKDSEVAGVAEEMGDEACRVEGCVKSNLPTMARVYKAFEDLIIENGYAAIAVGCWPKYRGELGIVPCSIIGRLLDKGYVAACEGDVDSALSMMLLRSVTGNMPMLMDLSKLDFDAGAALMWHCGSAPKCCSDSDGMALAGHYKPGGRIAGADDARAGSVGDMYFKPGRVTVARLTWEYERFLAFSGRFISNGDRSFDGSRGWVGDITMDGATLGLKDLVNTILVQRFQHHYPIVYGEAESEIREAMAWLGIKPLQMAGYRDYMQHPER